jgi:hypothetical protein
VPGRSRRAEQRRGSPFPILTATPLISASPGRTIFALSSTRGNAATRQRGNCASASYVAVRNAICHAQFTGQPASKAKSGRSDMSWSPRSRESMSPFDPFQSFATVCNSDVQIVSRVSGGARECAPCLHGHGGPGLSRPGCET